MHEKPEATPGPNNSPILAHSDPRVWSGHLWLRMPRVQDSEPVPVPQL